MLSLYYKPSCPYCLRVLTANETIKADVSLLDISVDESVRAELIVRGGKQQVPYLEDATRGVSMYESIDIIEYLAQYYGSGVVPETNVPGNVCPID